VTQRAALVLVVLAACGQFAAADGIAGGDAGSSGDAATDAGMLDGDATIALDAGGADGRAGRLLVFVTLVGYADITTPASADTKCNSEALGRLPGKFVAWYSTASAPAPSRLLKGGVPVDGPWFRVDEALVVTSRAALSNTAMVPLVNPINVTATGETRNASVWTATTPAGTFGVGCPSGGSTPTSGAADQVGPQWTEQTFFTAACGSSLAVYCFQVE
jgi:hypothetical protein